jgi:hypothetical protein
MKYLILSITFAGSLAGLSCNLLTGPDNNIQPGRRDYTWTVDTIRIFSNDIGSIWGSSPDNIWGVGPGGDLSTTIWHYDGTKWSTDGAGRNLSPECVYGFAKNDVWIGGQDGKIWHYDGNNWEQNYQHTINGFTGIGLYDLYGTSNHDFYAVGTVWFDNDTRRGIILHYNGSSWKQEYLADFNSYFAKIRVSYGGRCFIQCVKWLTHSSGDTTYILSGDTTVFYEFDGKNLKQIYSDENQSVKGGWMTVISGSIVFSLNDGIYKYTGNEFLSLEKYDSQRSPGAIFGRNDEDIFIGVADGVTQYNGTDIQLLVRTEGAISDAQIFPKDVVFLDMEFGRGDFIYHGKLK